MTRLKVYDGDFAFTMKRRHFEERLLIGRMDLRAWNTKLKLT
jgi:hypothetical protein